MLFSTLLKITPHNRQKRRIRTKETRKWGPVGTFTAIFVVGHPSSFLPRSTWLNLSSVTKKSSFARGIARYAFLVYVAMLFVIYPRCGDCAFSASFLRECSDFG